jgi:hypothetical protein
LAASCIDSRTPLLDILEGERRDNVRIGISRLGAMPVSTYQMRSRSSTIMAPREDNTPRVPSRPQRVGQEAEQDQERDGDPGHLHPARHLRAILRIRVLRRDVVALGLSGRVGHVVPLHAQLRTRARTLRYSPSIDKT